ncbi:MAG TPA: HAMP domain-containing sensor histidine kinase, partial [Gemmatimonadaceae bacterium]
GAITPPQREYLERIRASQQHLLGIINDLLNYSRIEAGQMNYQSAAVSIGAVVETVLPLLQRHAKSKDIDLVREGCPDAVAAQGDRMKIEQILLNLLSNAVKFTAPGGRIVVTSASSGEHVTVTVHDTGRGIAADQHDAIFEPFVQLGRSLTSPHEGTGLGLAISRDMARAMGGDITVESTEHVGSTFTFILPVATT